MSDVLYTVAVCRKEREWDHVLKEFVDTGKTIWAECSAGPFRTEGSARAEVTRQKKSGWDDDQIRISTWSCTGSIPNKRKKVKK